MSASTELGERAPARSNRSRLVIAALAVLVVAAIALDTKVVKIGSDEDVANEVFSPEKFGSEEFPKIQSSIEERAVDAKTLADAVVADKAAAAKQYGVPAGIGSVIPVSPSPASSATGNRGSTTSRSTACRPRSRSGCRPGPAINGTDLRDATGEIEFGHFTNQIEYQNAGAAINNEMKKQVLAERRHQHAQPARPSRWSAPSPWSIPRTGSSRRWS